MDLQFGNMDSKTMGPEAEFEIELVSFVILVGELPSAAPD
jgi:hypothetical protein